MSNDLENKYLNICLLNNILHLKIEKLENKIKYLLDEISYLYDEVDHYKYLSNKNNNVINEIESVLEQYNEF